MRISDLTASRNRGLWLSLAAIALLAAATGAAYRAPPPRPSNAPLSEFSGSRAKFILRELAGSGTPHPIGSAANTRLRAALVSRLEALGYRVELQTGTVCNEGVCGMPVNIVATPPAAEIRDAVLLAAHYDSVPAGSGASDDVASVAAALEIARILAARPPARHPPVLLITDGEEAGLLGAVLFVRDHPLAHRIRAAVNMDARGTSGLSLMFETGSANLWLMHRYAAAVERPITNSLYYVIYKLLPNDTDFTAFKQASYQGYNFAFIGHVGRYHTPLDDVDDASASSIQHQGDNALAAMTALLTSDVPGGAGSESVFFDVFGRGLVVWPASLTLPAALLALLLIGVETVLFARAREIAAAEMARAALGVLGALALGTALSAGLLTGLMAIGKVPGLGAASWLAHPLPMHAVSAALALLAASVASAWLAPRVRAASIWVVASLLIGVLATAVAAVAPGASFSLLLASGAAALGALPYALAALRFKAPGPGSRDLASLLPALVMFTSLASQVRFLYAALGSPAWPITTFVLTLTALYLMPFLAAATRPAQRLVTRIAAATAVAGAALTLALPTYSKEWPERVNLEYSLEADSGQAHYFVWADSGRLPASLASAASFEAAPRPRFPDSGVKGFFAAAPAARLAAPELTVVKARAATGAVAHFELHLRSPRGAPELLMIFPAAAHVSEASLTGASGAAQAQLHELRSGARLLEVAGLPVEGVNVGVDWKGALPSTVQLMDLSYGLARGAEIATRRGADSTASQNGDVTVVRRTVRLDTAGGSPSE